MTKNYNIRNLLNKLLKYKMVGCYQLYSSDIEPVIKVTIDVANNGVFWTQEVAILFFE